MKASIALGYNHTRPMRLLDHGGWRIYYLKGSHMKKLKLRILSERQNHRCAYCERKTWIKGLGETGCEHDKASIDHVVPKSKGGTWHMNNLIMSCSECNSIKGSKSAYIFWLHKNGTELDFSLRKQI